MKRGAPLPRTDTYHAPANSALVPGIPRLSPAEPSLARSITEALGISGHLDDIVGGARGRFFRLVADDGRVFFVKRATAENLGSQVRSNALAEWLAKRGVRTSTATVQTTTTSGEGVFAFPYVDWRMVDLKADELAATGRAVAGLHAVLAAHPGLPEWRERTAQRIADLSDLRRAIARGLTKPRLHGERIRELAGHADADFSAMDGAQPLHGDLHLGNLLMPRDEAEPIFVDFEDVFHSVLPARFELALFIERAILNRERNDEAAAALARSFLEAYFEGRPNLVSAFLASGPQTLRALSLRSLCVIVDCERHGVEIEAAEWDKFMSLFAQVDARARVFAQ